MWLVRAVSKPGAAFSPAAQMVAPEAGWAGEAVSVGAPRPFGPPLTAATAQESGVLSWAPLALPGEMRIDLTL